LPTSSAFRTAAGSSLRGLCRGGAGRPAEILHTASPASIFSAAHGAEPPLPLTSEPLRLPVTRMGRAPASMHSDLSRGLGTTAGKWVRQVIESGEPGDDPAPPGPPGSPYQLCPDRQKEHLWGRQSPSTRP
jgi:hypothetical protein